MALARTATPLAVGIDLGGSSAKLALVDATGAVLGERLVPTPSTTDPLAVLAPVARGVDDLLAVAAGMGREVLALGCGVPGNLDPTRAVILYNNVVALDGFPLRAWLIDRFNRPVALDNDACAAAIGETHALGSDERAGRVLFVTVGSGIGVVLVVGGEVVRLVEGVTGDAAHIVVDRGSSERCPIGCRGCLETVASGSAIGRAGRLAAESGESVALERVLGERGDVAGADVATAADSGDSTAREIIREAGRWLGVGLASWAPLYAPDLMLVGGGVSRAGDDWLRAAESEMREVGIPYYVSRVRVRRATLGNRAGVIGAGLLALASPGPLRGHSDG